MRKSLLFACLMWLGFAASAAPDPAPLYQQHCISCHGVDRLGGMGPALLPQNLERLKKPEALSVIASGRPATQMLGFQDKLKPEEIQALAEFIYTPPAVMPQWGEAEIRASRVEHVKTDTLSAKPQFSADPLNLFVVVEAGDHHVTILDGDKFEPIHRFPRGTRCTAGRSSRPTGAMCSLRRATAGSANTIFPDLKTVAEIRAGINTRNIAVSGDGQFVMVATTCRTRWSRSTRRTLDLDPGHRRP
jgi:cytochrome c553